MTTRPTARWRVLTWNLHGSAHPNLELVAEVVEGYAPDALCAQEVRRRQAKHLARRLGWAHQWARKHDPYSALVWWRTEGIAVFSPHPLSHVVRTTISSGAPSWSFRRRVLLAVTVTRGDDAMRVYDTHLSSDSPDDRITQARRVAEHVAQDGAPVAVMAGDLNAADAEVEVVREFHAVGLRDHGGECTAPAIAPRHRLDRVLVPEHGAVVDSHTPEGGEKWAAISDHLPVMVEFDA
jgi:endonuclease/exonuclease/phosphatase family metal-dependent hydrolase